MEFPDFIVILGQYIRSFFVRVLKQNTMCNKKKKTEPKSQGREERNADVMRARYAALMMGYCASADLLADEEKEG